MHPYLSTNSDNAINDGGARWEGMVCASSNKMTDFAILCSFGSHLSGSRTKTQTVPT